MSDSHWQSWGYLPLLSPYHHFEFPEDFEFGNGDDDDALFHEAWRAMISRGYHVAEFASRPDDEALEEAGGILARHYAPSKADFERLYARVMGEAEPKQAAQLVADSLTWIVEIISGVEVIFASGPEAQMAAMRLGGVVLIGDTP